MNSIEIEKKFLLRRLPGDLEQYPRHEIEQAYLCTDPVVRVRKEDETCYLTYKGKGMMAREEYNLPLNREAYEHLLAKADGNIISKTRYLIPLENGLTAELDQFHSPDSTLLMAEVEFSSEEQAESFTPPDWFGEEVTRDRRYHNSYMSQASSDNETFNFN